MSKYELLPEQLVHEGTLQASDFFSPGPVDEAWVSLCHDGEYVAKLRALTLSPKEVRRTGFPLSRSVIDREFMIAEGTRQCADFALQEGIAMNIAGGTHHAFTNRGEGFCLLNDIAIAARYLLSTGKATRIAVIDLDVHQGNGTAQIFQGVEDVFTFSMHGANNYPLVKEQSRLDIGLADFTSDAFYLRTVDVNVATILDEFMPDFIFYQSGVDILDTDKLGRLSVSRAGCKERDRLVLSRARQNRIPIVCSMGGGYSPDIRDIIEAHANTYRLAQEIYF